MACPVWRPSERFHASPIHTSENSGPGAGGGGGDDKGAERSPGWAQGQRNATPLGPARELWQAASISEPSPE